MLTKRVVPLFIAVAVVMAACGSSENSATTGGQPTSGPVDTPTATTITTDRSTTEIPLEVSEGATATARPGIKPPPFDIRDYENGNDVAELLSEAGDERAFPAELLPDSPELPLELARALATNYLNDTRIVLVKQAFRDIRIEAVVDYCDNGTREIKYLRTKTGPGPFANAEFRATEGWKTEWLIAHTDLTPWNEPYVAGLFDAGRAAFISRGWDATPVLRFKSPGPDGLFKLLSRDTNQHARVFDNPNCADPPPVLEYTPTQWSLIGLERMLQFPEGQTIADSQIDPGELVASYDQRFMNITTFSNLNAEPFLFFCDNHRGVVLGKNSAKFGEVFTWRIKDGSDIAPNGVWIIYEYDNTNWGAEHEFLFQEAEYNPLRAVVAAEIEDCSIERGLEYVDAVAPSIEWFQNRPATPVPGR